VAEPFAMTDPNDLMRQLADCIEDARGIIEGFADDPEARNAWLTGADQLLIAYDDHRRLQPAPGQPTRRNPLSGAQPEPQP
jgi:hypothetical protein